LQQAQPYPDATHHLDSINAQRAPAVENRLLRPAACAGARLVSMAERGAGELRLTGIIQD
jgi:hypothetical protein